MIETGYTTAIQEKILAQTTQVKWIAIHGTTGCGKTVLAQDFLRKYQAKNSTHSVTIFYAETANQWWSSLQDWLEERNPTIHQQFVVKSELRNKKKLLIKELENQLKQKDWCILLDNWDSENSLDWGTVKEWFNHGSGVLLVTTQSHSLFAKKECLLDLSNGFSCDESRMLINKVLQQNDSSQEILGRNEDLIALANKLNHLPLAVTQAASYLLWENINRNERGQSAFTCKMYEKLLEKKILEIIEKHKKLLSGKPDVPREPESERDEFIRLKTQEAAVNLSLRKVLKINTETPDMNLWCILCFCSFLAADGISQQLLADYLTSLSSDESNIFSNSFSDILYAAQKYSIIQFENNRSSVDGLRSLHVHRVIQHVLRDIYWPLLLNRVDFDRVESILCGMMRSILYDHLDGALENHKFKIIREYFPHIKSVLKKIFLPLVINDRTVPSDGLTFLKFNFQFRLAHAELSMGNYARAILAFEEYIKNHQEHDVDKYEGGLTLKAKALNNLGVALDYLGRKEEAKKCYLNAKAIGGLSSSSQFNLIDHQDLDEREISYRQILEEKTANVLSDTPNIEIANIQDNLATVLRIKGKYNEAVKLYELALNSAISCRGDSHINVAMIRQNLGVALEYSGDFEGAKNHLSIALSSAINHFGDSKEHAEVAMIQNNLARIFEKLNKLEDSKKLYKESLETRIKICSANEDVEITRQNLLRVEERLSKEKPAPISAALSRLFPIEKEQAVAEKNDSENYLGFKKGFL